MWLPLGHETDPRGNRLGHAAGAVLPPLPPGERAVGHCRCDLVPVPRLRPAGEGGCRTERATSLGLLKRVGAGRWRSCPPAETAGGIWRGGMLTGTLMIVVLLEGGQGTPVLARSTLGGSNPQTKVRFCCPWWERCCSCEVVGLCGSHEPRTAGGVPPPSSRKAVGMFLHGTRMELTLDRSSKEDPTVGQSRGRVGWRRQGTSSSTGSVRGGHGSPLQTAPEEDK